MTRIFPELLNARDLGGHMTSSGAPTRMKAFVRADLPNRLTPAGIQEVIDYGIRTVIDLRWLDELARSPNPLAQQTEIITYLHHSLLGDSYASAEERDVGADKQNEHYYQNILDVFQVELAQILRTMANAQEGGILFHCKMGKDRTGIMAMLLLSLVEVPEQTIIDDYVLTGVMLEEEHARYLSQFDDPEMRKLVIADQQCLPEYAQKTLNHFTTRYGSVHRYLATIGLSSNEVERISRRLIG